MGEVAQRKAYNSALSELEEPFPEQNMDRKVSIEVVLISRRTRLQHKTRRK
jgi:hypothetical protein